MDVDASLRGVRDDGDAREALREAREHANSLERAQAALNGEMRRMANEYERVRGELDAVSREKEEVRHRASAAWTEMTAEIETLKAELERARGGKAEGDAGEDAIDELTQKAP